MAQVTYREFAKLDLRVGTIEKVEPVPGTDKLYKLTVNLGKERRIIVSGIRDVYDIADLHGRQIVVIANLEPKVIKGVESQGMLLAADDGKRLALIIPDKRVEDGAKVL